MYVCIFCIKLCKDIFKSLQEGYEFNFNTETRFYFILHTNNKGPLNPNPECLNSDLMWILKIY